MRWLIDIDGTITSNPQFFSFLTYQIRKKENSGNVVHILTNRNPNREHETIDTLIQMGIEYDHIHFMKPEDGRTHKDLMIWKMKKAKELDPDIWFDNDFKLYKQLYSMDIKSVLPRCEMIQI